jgi:uncharacterized membrane protein
MEERNNFVPQSIGFAFKSLINYVRLFVIILLVATGAIVLVVAILALLNKGLIQALANSQVLQDYQSCSGYNCALIAYQSGATLSNIISSHMISLLVSAVIIALFFVGLDLGLKKIALEINDGNRSSCQALFSCFQLAPKALVGWILYCLMICIGSLLFVLPGFIALLRFIFFPYFIIDKNAGPIDALKMSFEITKDHMWEILALWIAIKIIISLGFVSWIGVILTWPLSTLAYAYFYRKLVSHELADERLYTHL